MKKRMLALLLTMVLALTPLLGACTAQPAAQPAAEPQAAAPAPAPAQPEAAAEPAPAEGEAIELTMGSWRTDDVEQMNKLLEAYKTIAPNVTIVFQPTNPPDYNSTLRLPLSSCRRKVEL